MEIYLYGEWGTITYYSRSADVRDAHVVCRQLGYDTQCENKDIIVSVYSYIYFDPHIHYRWIH